MYDPELRGFIESAYSRLVSNINATDPVFAKKVLAWIQAVSGDLSPIDHLTHQNAFPFFLIPYWLEKSINPEFDKQFQEDIIFSSFNLYYYVIMLDNLMDQDQLEALELSPALHLFHTWFQLPYQNHFPGGHSFWDDFQKIWFQTAVVTTADACLTNIDEKSFLDVSSQKAYFAGIPTVAVCLKHGRPDLVEPWTRFFYAFGQWNQMFNDVVKSWERDIENDSLTFFLCEGKKRKKPDESLYTWVIREGYGWGLEFILDFTRKMKEDILPYLECEDINKYVLLREDTIRQRLTHFNNSKPGVDKLREALGLG